MIFMSLEVQIEGSQFFSKHQKQRNKDENMNTKKRTFVIFCLSFFEEKTLTFLIFKPQIFVIFSPF
jgi:hypothetical protein